MFSLHLRNLSWPWLLSKVILFSDRLSGSDVVSRLWCVRAVTLFFDLLGVWGIFSVARSSWIGERKNLFLFLATALWFWVGDAVRPSQEHLAIVFTWIALGAWVRGWWFLAGVALAGIFVGKYSVGVLALGLGVGFALDSSEGRFRRRLMILVGACSGFVVGGIADWHYYGRPYESLWMYLQYNVFTTHGKDLYGTQPLTAYWDFFRGRYLPWLFPVLLVGVPSVVWGVARSFKSRASAPWALGLALYGTAHLLIGHKEARFMAPWEPLLLIAGVRGWMHLRPWLERKLTKRVGPVLGAVGALVVITNVVLTARAGWGDLWRYSQTYEQVSEVVRSQRPAPCAVVTPVRPMSVRLASVDGRTLAYGFFAYRGREKITVDSKIPSQFPLLWVEQGPTCKASERFLLHMTKPSPRFEQEGCLLIEQQPQGSVFRLIGKEVSGPWYTCPASALMVFKRQEARRVLARTLPKFEKLPDLGLSGDAIEAWSRRYTPVGMQGGDMVDW